MDFVFNILALGFAMVGLVISDIILLATTELKILKFGTEKRTQ